MLAAYFWEKGRKNEMSESHCSEATPFAKLVLDCFKSQLNAKRKLSELEESSILAILSFADFPNIKEQNRLVEEGYDGVASVYDEVVSFLQYLCPEKVVDAYLESIDLSPTENICLLDAGSGTGLVGDRLRSQGFKGQIHGVDQSQNILDFTARARSACYTSLRKANIMSLDHLKDNSVDAVLSAGVIGMAPPETLDELVRVVRTGGRVIYSLWDTRYDKDPTWEQKHLDLAKSGLWRLIDSLPTKHLCYANPAVSCPNEFYLFGFEVLPYH